MIKLVPLSLFLRLYHFYGLFTAYLLDEEVMSVRLYAMNTLSPNSANLLLQACIFVINSDNDLTTDKVDGTSSLDLFLFFMCCLIVNSLQFFV